MSGSIKKNPLLSDDKRIYLMELVEGIEPS
jgi:hypothetical protein